jgi:glycosyltransferase involved in cell wall biosynthesis
VTIERPTFSVVMPAYDAESTIRHAVDSVFAQTEQDFEIVVVDDGSSDATVERLAAIDDPRLRVLQQENRGAAAARNTAISAARAPFVSFLDSDDLWMPTYLEAMRRGFADDLDIAFVYTDAWVLDPDRGRVSTVTAMHWQRPPVHPPPTPEDLLLELLDRNFIYAATTVRRAVLDELGPFDERLGAAVDYEMWLRIAASGYRAGKAVGLQGVYRKGRPGSISSNRRRVWQSLAEVYRIVAEEYDVSQAVRSKATSRRDAARREVEALSGGGAGLDGAWRTRFRPALVGLKTRVLRRERWYDVPPGEVADAFPWLVSLQRR